MQFKRLSYSCMSEYSPLIIAHRGESRDAPENTLAAINLAWARGARAVEIDVMRTADDRMVVFHDNTTERICKAPGSVRDRSYSALRRLDAGRWKNSKWTGERIPLLAETLKTMPARCRLFIEVKDSVECVPRLQGVIRRACVRPEQLLVMSFDTAVVQAVASALPRCKTALVVGAQCWKKPGGVLRFCRLGRSIGCDALDFEVDPKLNRKVVETVHREGMRLYCWTVNRLPTARRLAAAGIDGITTDRCEWLETGLRQAVDGGLWESPR